MRQVLCLFAFLSVAPGCNELPPVKTAIDVSTLRVSKEQSLGTSDVGIALDVIAPDNLAAHPGVVAKVRWREPDHSQVHTGGPPATHEESASVSLLPLPAFVVRIANHTDAPISFQHAEFLLKDDAGHSYKIYKDSAELQGRVQSDLVGAHANAGTDQNILDWLGNAVAQLPLLNQTTSIAAGSEWQGYLVFKIDAHDLAELDALLAHVSSLTLHVSGAQASRPFDLLASVEKQRVPLTMSCPGGTQPSVQRCKLIE